MVTSNAAAGNGTALCTNVIIIADEIMSVNLQCLVIICDDINWENCVSANIGFWTMFTIYFCENAVIKH